MAWWRSRDSCRKDNTPPHPHASLYACLWWDSLAFQDSGSCSVSCGSKSPTALPLAFETTASDSDTTASTAAWGVLLQGGALVMHRVLLLTVSESTDCTIARVHRPKHSRSTWRRGTSYVVAPHLEMIWRWRGLHMVVMAAVSPSEDWAFGV